MTAQPTVPMWQIDAFTRDRFRGNPAAVCRFEQWPEDSVLQSIAAENNLPETAFIVAMKNRWDLRWFTPTTEMELCGHATLAAGWVILNELDPSADMVQFSTRWAGELSVSREQEMLALSLPSCRPVQIPLDARVTAALGAASTSLWRADRLLAVFETERQVAELTPDLAAVATLDHTLCVTAPGNEVDFVSRFFAPQKGVDEDPVTGSAHCVLAPYWAKILGKSRLEARQLSQRGGELTCVVDDNRVTLLGDAVPYLRGSLWV